MNTFALIPGMTGVPEILLIIFVILLLFGSKKLPELARSLGKSLNEFKRGQTETKSDRIEKQAEPADEPEKKTDDKASN